MKKQELVEKLESAREQLKDYNKFIDLMRDKEDPKGILTRLNQTVGRILMLLEANEVKEVAHPTNKAIEKPVFGETGSLVKVRPCGDKYGKKTYLGFLIGEVALGSSWSVSDDKIQLEFAGHNPAIFVPELGEIIYGAESWWEEIESEDELKEITDSDIDNVWYVKLLKEKMNSKND